MTVQNFEDTHSPFVIFYKTRLASAKLWLEVHVSKATVPEDESERIKTLDSYEILDSLPERSFDDLVAVAAQMCGTPIALISLVDRDRQWFKARVGLEVCETDRDVSFCAHTLVSKQFLNVDDAKADERFADNPLVTGDPKIRFYAGAPLISSSGQVLGTICVIDQIPRKLNSIQKQTLEALARLVVDQLEIRRTNRELGKKIAEVSDLNLMIEQQHKAIISNAKMVSLAEMAGGMAHEINNPLAIILGKVEQLDHILSADSFDLNKAKAAAQKIGETALRIHRIISGLIAFSRGNSGDTLAAVSLRSILNEAVNSVSSKARELKARVEIASYDDKNESVHCRPPQFVQSLVNVLNNALDSVQETDQKLVTLEVKTNGEHTEIYVVDTGSGIPEEVRHKVMQPFFTTKGPHRGTGLGLSVAKGMMESQGGNLIYLEEARATTFVLKLKRVTGA